MKNHFRVHKFIDHPCISCGSNVEIKLLSKHYLNHVKEYFGNNEGDDPNLKKEIDKSKNIWFQPLKVFS